MKGLAVQGFFRTVLLTTGEQPLASFSHDGGARARTIALWGSPFGKTDSETGTLAASINDSVKRNYGHAGKRFVEFLVHNRDKWSGWKKEFRIEQKKYRELANSQQNPFAGRVANYLASIVVTAKIVHEALSLPWKFSNPVDSLWDEIAQHAGEANLAAVALRVVMDWAYAHQEEFYRKAMGSHQPPQGWAGRWDATPSPKEPIGEGDDSEEGSNGDIEWTSISFTVDKINTLLRGHGHEPASILRAWRDSGWLILSKEADGVRRCFKERIGKMNSVRVIKIGKSVIDQVMQD